MGVCNCVHLTNPKEALFWNMALQGTALTIVSGHLRTNGEKRITFYKTDKLAKQKYDTLILEKLQEGYIECTANTEKPIHDPTRDSLEQALVENPDDLASHMVQWD